MVGSSTLAMPPQRSNLTSSFSVTTDANNEVVCPLRNQDGSACRKRCLGVSAPFAMSVCLPVCLSVIPSALSPSYPDSCTRTSHCLCENTGGNIPPRLQEKRYRSMQEHIRRAHPEHYISKLPATEESFQLMITTPPSERPPPPPPPPQTSARPAPRGLYASARHPPILTSPGYDRTPYDSASAPNTPRNTGYAPLMQPAATTAAAALAQMHNKIEPDWDSEPVRPPPPERTSLLTVPQDWHSDTDNYPRSMLSSIELPPLRRSNIDPTSDPYNPLNPRPRPDHLSTLLSRSPPGRSSTLPPIQRHPPARPRKQSVSKRARDPPHHRRQKSRESQLQSHMRRMSYERKAFSAEPSSGLASYGKRWEDLIDAATSATSDVNEDRTPVRPHSSPTRLPTIHQLTRQTGPPVPPDPPLPPLRPPLLPPPHLRPAAAALPILPGVPPAAGAHPPRAQRRRRAAPPRLPQRRVRGPVLLGRRAAVRLVAELQRQQRRRRRLGGDGEARGLEGETSRRQRARPDLLRGVPGGQRAAGELCVHRVRVRHLPDVCRCADGGAGGKEEVSEVCVCGGAV